MNLSQTAVESSSWPVAPDDDIPLLFEDEEEEEKEETGKPHPHSWAVYTLFSGVYSILGRWQPLYQTFSNLNCYYEVRNRRSIKTGKNPNFAADLMCVKPYARLPIETTCYAIGKDGPEPTTVIEVLSQDTAFPRDLKEKLELYRKLKIQEYILVDITGAFLPQKIQLQRLQANGKWQTQADKDGGLTSQLGFRLLIDETDIAGLFVVDALTGTRCVRMFVDDDRVYLEKDARRLAEQQVKQEADARRLAEQQVRALQAEIERLRNPQQDT